MMKNCNPYILEYIELVRSGKYPVCTEQVQLIELVERVLDEDGVYIDGEQLEKYLSYQKYFPYDLFPWEKFLFALHNCTYTADGFPRFSHLVIYGGRGLGKNGYLAFENFCMLTNTNPVKNYNIYDYANSEKQAKRSWNDVYEIMNDPQNKAKLSRFFTWNSERIKNIKTGSEYWYMANNAKTGDSYRPGKVNHDEVHEFEDTSALTTSITGLGKVDQPRRTTCTTDGDVRGGYLDDLLGKCRKILNGEVPDNGTLPFLCHVESEAEITDPAMWYKANPSLQYRPTLMWEIKQELGDYLENPIAHSAFATKRMNFPPKEKEGGIAKWEQIEATSQPIVESMLKNRPCIGAVDYAKTNDFVSAGLLYFVGGKYIWVTHTWVCTNSADLKANRIKAPLRVWEKAGHLTFVDAQEIPPELPAVWIATEAARRGSVIIKFACDFYRFAWLRRALESVNITGDKKNGKVMFVRPSNEMMISPIITSGFVNNLFVWGDNPLMRWAAWNSKLVMSSNGNITYGKIEPKSRKTDPFKAFVAGMCFSDELEKYDKAPQQLAAIPFKINIY